MRKYLLRILTYLLIVAVIVLGVLIGINFTQLTRQIQTGSDFSAQNPPVYRYMVILDGAERSFSEGMQAGMDRASEDYSVAYELWSFTGTDRHDDIIRQLDIGIESGVDGILVQAFEDERFEELLIKAKRMAVPIITLTDDVPSQEKVSAVSYNKYQMGSRIGNLLNGVLMTDGIENGTVAIIQNSSLFDQDQAFAVQEALSDGFAVQPISFMSANDSILNAEEMAVSIIDEYDDLVAFICLSSEETLGVISALKDANLVEDVVIIGSDDDPAIMDYIRRGVLDATIVADVENVGYTAIWDMTKYNEGHFVTQYRDIPVKIVSQANLEAYIGEVGEDR